MLRNGTQPAGRDANMGGKASIAIVAGHELAATNGRLAGAAGSALAAHDYRGYDDCLTCGVSNALTGGNDVS